MCGKLPHRFRAGGRKTLQQELHALVGGSAEVLFPVAESGNRLRLLYPGMPLYKKGHPHPRFVRTYISRNPVNQRIALTMDNIFYGKKFKLKAQKSQEKFFGLPPENGDSSVSPES